MVLVEICTDSLTDTIEAIRLGADRIELCSELAADGLSPSRALLEESLALGKRYGVIIFPMVRCRGGDFVYSDSEKERMISEAVGFARDGVPGIVVGALDAHGRPDMEFISTLANKVRVVNPGIDITFHKAIDVVQMLPGESFVDMVASLEPYCSRVLTSGGSMTAVDGALNICQIRARGKNPRPLAAGKIRAENVLDVIRTCGVDEVHSRSPLVATAVGKAPRNMTS